MSAATITADPHEAAVFPCPGCGARPSTVRHDAEARRAWARASDVYSANVPADPGMPLAPRLIRVAVTSACGVALHGRDYAGSGVTLATEVWERVESWL